MSLKRDIDSDQCKDILIDDTAIMCQENDVFSLNFFFIVVKVFDIFYC